MTETISPQAVSIRQKTSSLRTQIDDHWAHLAGQVGRRIPVLLKRQPAYGRKPSNWIQP